MTLFVALTHYRVDLTMSRGQARRNLPPDEPKRIIFPRVGQCQDQSLAPERGYQKERYIFEHTNTINWSIEVDYVTIGRRYGPSANICDSEVWRLFASRTWGLLPFGTVLNYSSQLEFRSDVAKRLYMRVAFQSCLLCLCAYYLKNADK